MALVLADRVKETAAAPGTGTVTLLGAEDGYQSFSAIGNANTTYYTISDQSGNNWEVGIGTYTASGATLTRDTVLSSSNAGSLVNFSSGVQDVFVTYPSEFSQTAQVGDIMSSNEVPTGPGTWLEAGKYYSKAAYPALATKLGNVPDLGVPAQVPQAQLPAPFATNTTATNPYVSATDGTTTVVVGQSGAIRKTINGTDWTPVASTTTSTLNEVRYMSSLFVAVGAAGTIVSSSDGTNWVNRASALTTGTLNSVAYGAGRYVVVGAAGAIISSADLITWNLSTGTGANAFQRVVFGASVFVAAGVSGACYSSSDGITWTSRSAGSATFNDLIFDGTQFVAVCASQAYTSTDGITWAPNDFGIAGGPVATNGTLHVMVGSSGQIRKSADGGETWAYVASPTANTFVDIQYINSRFVAVGGSTVCSSTDGTTWALNSGSGSTSIAYGAGKYVGVGSAGLVRYSTDLVTWTTVSWPDANNLAKVIFANSLFVAVSRNSVFTSADGVTWTTYTFTNMYPTDVIWTGSKFIVAGALMVTSPDGVTWTTAATLTNVFPASKIANNGSTTYVVGGTNDIAGTAVSIYSTDSGTTWTVTSALTYGNNLGAVVWDGTQFVASVVGNMTGGYYTSTDGITWTAYATSQRTAITNVVAIGSKSFAVTSAGFSLLTGGPQVWKMKVGAWPYTVAASSAPNPRCLAYDGSGTYVLGGSMGATSPYPGILRSSDAVTWSGSYGTNSINNINVAYYLNSRWFVLGSGGYAQTSTDAITWTQSAYLGSPALNAMAYGASTYVVVGGAVRYSTNGTTWTSASAGAQTFNDVIFANSLFVAVGAAGTCYTSPDGITWTSRSAGSSAFNRLLYANSLFVAVGAAGAIYTSTDGATWTSQTSNVSGELRDVVWDGAQYVAVGVSGSITTSPDGTTWTARTSGVTVSLNSISWSGTRFVVTNTTNTNALVSTNGSSWTVVVTAYPTGNTLFSGYLGGKFVSVGANFTQYSSDGLTWSNSGNTQTAVGFGSNTPNQITYANSQYVVVSNNGGIYTSSNAIDWTTRTSGTTRTLYASAWNGSNYVVVGASGVYLTSPDGATWTPAFDVSASSFLVVSVISAKTIAFGPISSVIIAGGTRQEVLQSGTWGYTVGAQSTPNPRVIAYNGSNLYVAAGSGGALMSSPNGQAWTGRYANVTTNFDKVAYLNGNWIAMGGSGSAANLLTSPDASTWTAPTAGTAIYNYAAYGASVYVVVGASGAVYSSPDLATWTSRSAGIQTFNDVVFANSVFVAVGNAGAVYSSADGITWASRTAGSANFQRIIYANGLFLAIGSGGSIYTSSDGTTWTSRTSNTSSQLVSIVWTGTQFCAVGSFSIVTSPDGVTWTLRNTGDTSQTFLNISWSGTKFLAMGVANASAFTSTDGVTWTRVSTANVTGTTLYSGYLGGKFIAIGSGWIQASIDGFTWTNCDQTQYVPTTINWLSKKGGFYYALTNKGMFQSSDGLTFTAVRSVFCGPVLAVAYSGTAWLATAAATAGSAQPFYKSTDGTTWVKSSELGTLASTSTLAGAPSDLTYAAGKFIVGQTATTAQNIFLPIYTSSDGVTWTGRQTPYTIKPNAFASNGSTVIYTDTTNGILFKSTDAGNSWISVASSGTFTGSAAVQYTNGAWFFGQTSVSKDLQNISQATASATYLYSDGTYTITVFRQKNLSSTTVSGTVTLPNMGANYVPSAITVASTASIPELAVRGTTALVPVARSDAFFPYLIADYPLYSYNTSTTFFVPPAVAGNNGSTSYMYAGA